METEIPYIFYELKNVVIGIAGLGGLGSNVAFALVRMGVGKLIIADFDVIEANNLTRQQYFADQIGRVKVEVMVENLKRIRPDVNIEAKHVRLTPENIPEVFAEADVIAECFDREEEKQMLVETVLVKMEKPVIVSVSGLAGYGRSNDIKTQRISKRHILVGDCVSGIGRGIPLTASRVGIAANHQANAIVEVAINELNDIRARRKK